MARFTPGELNVMRLLWAHGEMKPGEIQERFPDEIKNAALRSYLTILLDKGHVKRRKVGKAFFYQASTRQQSALKTTIDNVIDTYCGGSMKELLMSLIRSEKMSAEDLEELTRLAQQDDADQTGSAAGKTRTGKTKATKRKVAKKKVAKKKVAKKKTSGSKRSGS